ncbi:MAG: YebC/PmpR family DNA-binding transcriptional regulator [Candidatus Omnitrophica bacterium]|nr:YebC/PmpR family DNA-binding transcriptional regulator [Candidatus Omnitrophota bacterium]MBU1996520.1 YebC/PmpR family DNA-binding transcriptional regulator [Candidatus Omnitrophota bacterium]MBU4333167.1 YebC/PmpR family DNA-binding transcriptional regulator [Candidatus Omnitrophota bacterium]
MSGHSKWASIKHKKAATDAKRGAAFTRAIREITAIAKAGGGNPEMNPSLRTAIDKARSINMPSNNIDNAIKKGTGELPGVTYEEVTFDAYGPGGVAVLISGLTDNKNRTTAEIRNILSKKNGSLAGPGSTAFLFSKKGFVAIEKSKISEDDLMGIVLDAGAEDIDSEGENHEITCEISDLEAVKDALKAKEIQVMTAEMTMIPSTTVKVVGNDAKQLLALMEALEDQEDVQNVYANFDISDEEMERLAQE